MSSVWEPILHKLVERDFIISTTTEQSIPEFGSQPCIHTARRSRATLNSSTVLLAFLPIDGRTLPTEVHQDLSNTRSHHQWLMLWWGNGHRRCRVWYWLFERFDFRFFQFFRFSHSLVNKTVLRRRYVFSLPLLSYYYMFLILSLS